MLTGVTWKEAAPPQDKNSGICGGSSPPRSICDGWAMAGGRRGGRKGVCFLLVRSKRKPVVKSRAGRSIYLYTVGGLRWPRPSPASVQILKEDRQGTIAKSVDVICNR